MNGSTSSGEDDLGGHVTFLIEDLLLRELFDILNSTVSYNMKFSMIMRCHKEIKAAYMNFPFYSNFWLKTT